MDIAITKGSINLVNEEILRNVKSAPSFSIYRLFSRISSRVIDYFQKKALDQQTRIYLLLKGLHEVIVENEGEFENPKNVLGQFKKTIDLLSLQNDLYSKSDYFDSPDIKERILASLQLCYTIEAELKIIAYGGKSRVKTESGFKNALVTTSHYALQKKLTALS